jgi:hypothetical protein
MCVCVCCVYVPRGPSPPPRVRVRTAGIARELGRLWRVPKGHPKADVHAKVEKILKAHVSAMMDTVENAQRTYSVSRSSTGTLSFMEWEGVLRLVGVNLGDHFAAHMTHRVRHLAPPRPASPRLAPPRPVPCPSLPRGMG